VDASNLIALLSNPKFYAILFGAIIATRLLCAPYWVWKAEKDKAEQSTKHGAGMSLRELQELGDHTAAIREQTEEIRRQRQGRDARDGRQEN